MKSTSIISSATTEIYIKFTRQNVNPSYQLVKIEWMRLFPAILSMLYQVKNSVRNASASNIVIKSQTEDVMQITT